MPTYINYKQNKENHHDVIKAQQSTTLHQLLMKSKTGPLNTPLSNYNVLSFSIFSTHFIFVL